MEPVAEVDVKVPGVMLMLVAPVVDHVSVLLEPALMLAGFAAKELIAGLAALTVTVAVAMAEPELLVAVSVYVVVVVGLTPVDPVAEVDENVPGVTLTLVAPVVAQLNVALAPGAIPVGFAANDVIVGCAPFPDDEDDVPPQATKPRQPSVMKMSADFRGWGVWFCMWKLASRNEFVAEPTLSTNPHDYSSRGF